MRRRPGGIRRSRRGDSERVQETGNRNSNGAKKRDDEKTGRKFGKVDERGAKMAKNKRVTTTRRLGEGGKREDQWATAMPARGRPSLRNTSFVLLSLWAKALHVLSHLFTVSKDCDRFY